MRIDWTATALEDRDYIFEYIRGNNPRAAERIDAEIETQVDLLAASPWIGRGGRIAGKPEPVINRSPYLAIYQVEGDAVSIHRILHGAQQWPPEN